VTQVALALTMVTAFLALLRIALPRNDGTPRAIGRNEHVVAAYSVILVALLIGGIALLFGSAG
jgi:hypothetical protein